MTKITILRTEQEMPKNLDAARELLFGALEGFGETSKKAWRRLWGRIIKMEAGELVSVDAVIPRNSKFHRKFFALLTVGFDGWEPGRKHKTYKGRPVEKNFDAFREEVTILSGFYTQTFDLQGRMRLHAKSISFSAMEEPEFEAYYSAIVDVLLQHVLTNYANREELDSTVEKIMGFV